MTVVEFFINSPLENMISCMSLRPQKVIFVGDGRRMRRFVSIYESVAKRLGIDSVFEVRTAPNNSINALTKVLTDIIETEDDCCFDLTGGEDLALVAMGIVFQSYKGVKNIQMQRFNIRTGRLIDCDSDDDTPSVYSSVSMKVHEYIALFGGAITDSVKYDATRDEDLKKLWDICRMKPHAWNKAINVLGQSAVTRFDEGKSYVEVDKIGCFKIFGNTFKFEEIKNFISYLSEKGLVKNVEETNNKLSFAYSSSTVKKCLSKAGDVLELTVLSAASRLKNNDGTPYYNDCISGVVIDWDGVYGSSSSFNGTVNEIDAILMRGLTPVFVSCKNGSVDESELYKLATVSDRFGGVYAKKVLILSNFKKKGYAKEYFLQRAKDMDIRIVENAGRLTEEELASILKKL